MVEASVGSVEVLGVVSVDVVDEGVAGVVIVGGKRGRPLSARILL